MILQLNQLEKKCVDDHRENVSLSRSISGSVEEWTEFGIRFLLECMAILRDESLRIASGAIMVKDDGSPTISIEHEIERQLANSLSQFNSKATFFGEESGGHLNKDGFSVAIDPIDGTRAFLNNDPTAGTSLAIFKDGVPFLGFVSNHITSEIIYGPVYEETRLIQLGVGVENDSALTLPLEISNRPTLIVSVHPSRTAMKVLQKLHEQWNANIVQQVRSIGGSPAWFLAEAAKGMNVYVNMWSGRASEPFDIAAGVTILEGAGGYIFDRNGERIDSLSHTGPFVAGVNLNHVFQVCEILRNSETPL